MAGQPQEPSWQPGGQDQAREAWPPPPPSFTPQPGAARDTFAYPQPPAYGQQGPQGQQAPPAPQAQPGQGYPPPTYDPADQDRAQALAQGQAEAQNQGMPQWQANEWQANEWQANPGTPPARSPRARGEKGFIGSLFDFSFKSMVTPKIIKVLYVLLTACIGLWALIFTIFCFKHAGAVAGFFVLIVLDPIFVLLTLGVYRVVFEFVMVTFRLHEDVQAIRAKAEAQD
jgi:hypothetical protein